MLLYWMWGMKKQKSRLDLCLDFADSGGVKVRVVRGGAYLQFYQGGLTWRCLLHVYVDTCSVQVVYKAQREIRAGIIME